MVPEALTVEGVWKGYSRGAQWTEVLADVSFEVEPGEITAVTGSRFEGKTTLLKIAAGIEHPDKGAVSLGGRRLGDCSDGARSRLLGHRIVWIDGRGPMLNMEVATFVGWPLALHGHGRREAERAAVQALERVGARECLGRRWEELSNRQRLAVSLARAFAGSPRVVVVDDLLDALGGRGTEEASDLVRSEIEASRPRCGVLMSASDLESAIYADRVWTITPKRSLKLVSGRRTEGEVLPFPDRDRPRAGGSLGAGAS
jgi:ABC-type lipoprotein export system ATPase subunit